MEFLALLSAHVFYVPFYILWLGGIVYAVVTRQKHPRTSLFAGIGFGILILESVLSAILMAYIQYQSFTNDLPPTQLGVRMTILTLCSLPFSIAGWVLLLMAIFGPKNLAERDAEKNHVDQDILL